VKVLVIGAGQMGAGIAQVAAQAGDTVLLNDISPVFIEKGLSVIKKNLARSVEKGKLSAEENAAILGRITARPELSGEFDVDISIEAATENLPIKLELFKKLDALLPANAILASNTSSISITKLGGATKRPQQVIGMHYFNPVPVMKLVEVIRGIATSQVTFETVRDLAKAHGKTPVEVNDLPGFAANRILCPMLNEAIYALYEGTAGVEEIDTVMTLGMNHPMGPLTLADFVGLDTLLAIMEVLYDGYGDPKYRPCPLLRLYVDAGWLGRKTKRGFYDYTGEKPVPTR
jgi:3-hydroxybutyryl-CoA dehydrogenase